MDVSETLVRLREAVTDWHIASGTDTALVAATSVVDHFEQLDEWLSRGGFLPTEWSNDTRGGV